MTIADYVKLDRGLVAVAGSDRRTFLQGLISQDIDRVSNTNAASAVFLTPQGKYLHDFCVAEIGDRLILDGENGRADDLITRMKRYKLRAKVEVTRANDLAIFAVFGANADAALGLEAKAGTARPLGDGVAFVDPRSAALGCRLILPAASSDTILAGLPVQKSTYKIYDEARIQVGIPDGTRDMDVEKSTLLECNFDSFNGIDWEKGCYIGQEVTARTKYRGLTKRRLTPVFIEGNPAKPGTAILANAKEVGEIRSIVDGTALALLRIDALDDTLRTVDGAIVTPLQ